TINALNPVVNVSAIDNNALPNTTTVTLDVDTNNDGNFNGAEDFSTTGTLTNGSVAITLNHPLATGTTAGIRARVTDVAGNQGTSATSTAQVVANSAWTTTDVTAMPDALQGDGMSLLGNLSASAPLDLDQSPGTSVAGNPALAYNSDWVNNKPIITAQVQS